MGRTAAYRHEKGIRAPGLGSPPECRDIAPGYMSRLRYFQ